MIEEKLLNRQVPEVNERRKERHQKGKWRNLMSASVSRQFKRKGDWHWINMFILCRKKKEKDRKSRSKSRDRKSHRSKKDKEQQSPSAKRSK